MEKTYNCIVIKMNNPFTTGIEKGYSLDNSKYYKVTKLKDANVQLVGMFTNISKKEKSYFSLIVTPEFCREHLKIIK